MIVTIVKANNYMDSIFLMKATKELLKVEGVKDAVVVMGSDMNKTVLAEFGGLTEEAKAACPNDLIISLDVESAECEEKANQCLLSLMTKDTKENKGKTGAAEKAYTSLEDAKEEHPDANLVMISLPGEYAGLEAKKALKKGMHVFIFSDLPVEEEIALKKLGAEKNLLVMGPGAGTAIIDGVSIGLMSKVRRGNVGIVAASGSGLQEVAVFVHKNGYGISQAIGTGGRDLSQAVGGSMMLRGIRMLEQDPDTDVIVLVSKPPHPDTCEKIYKEISVCKKPAVIFFLGGDQEDIRRSGAYAAATLEEAAEMACMLLEGKTPLCEDYIAKCRKQLQEEANAEKQKLGTEQKYLRGLYCGGTHSEEAVMLLQGFLPNLHSNIRFGKTELLENRHISVEHSLVDMGDEEFTKGRPHPVMDPTILCDRMLQEGNDPETAVILFDIILGHGTHEDPVSCIEDTLKQIQEQAKAQNRYISIVAAVCGTDLDPQNMKAQMARLEQLGIKVFDSNGKAAMYAGLIVA